MNHESFSIVVDSSPPLLILDMASKQNHLFPCWKQGAKENDYKTKGVGDVKLLSSNVGYIYEN